MNAQHTRFALSIDVEIIEPTTGSEPVITIEHVHINSVSSTAIHQVRTGDGIAETPGGWCEAMNQFEAL